MSTQLGPIEICCDAPSYQVVQACRYLGFQSPEDVRWLRMSRFGSSQKRRQHGLASLFSKLFGKKRARRDRTCTCGKTLPELRSVVVTFNNGDEAFYFLGQCSGCRTISWDEPDRRSRGYNL